MFQLSYPCMTTGKTIVLTIWTFVGKVMSLLFNTLSRFVIIFLPRSKCLLISWLQSLSASDFGAQDNKICHYFHFIPIYLSQSNGTMILVFGMLSFKPAFSLPSFHSSRGSLIPLHLSVIRVISPAYLRLLVFLPAILIKPSSLALRIMYSAYKLNKQGENIQPWCTPFLILILFYV